MIVINGTEYTSDQDLPQRYQDLLALIHGGVNWFKWAAKTAEVFQGRNLREFFLRIAIGLHETTMIRFELFQADFGVFLDMKSEDLKNLANIKEGESGTTDEQAGAIAKRYHLKLYNDLATAREWATKSGQSDFWIYGHDFEGLLILDRLQQIADKQLKKAAHPDLLAFGNKNARTVAEFEACCLFYLAFCQDQNPPSVQVQKIYDRIDPVANYLIYSVEMPNYSLGDLTYQQLTGAISQVSYIGFRNKAAACLYLALNFMEDMNEQVDVSALAQKAVGQLAEVRSRLESGLVISLNAAQDGRSRTINMGGELFMAQLRINSLGRITLVPAAYQFKRPLQLQST